MMRAIPRALFMIAFTVRVIYAQSNACDLDINGLINARDVEVARDMALGILPCTANVEGPVTCTVVTVQRVVNAALGQSCLTYNAPKHSVSLSWNASPSPGASGYNVYRKTTAMGTYTKLNSSPIVGLTFSDASVQLGTTYYYAVKAADASGNESVYSNEAAAVIPTI